MKNTKPKFSKGSWTFYRNWSAKLSEKLREMTTELAEQRGRIIENLQSFDVESLNLKTAIQEEQTEHAATKAKLEATQKALLDLDEVLKGTRDALHEQNQVSAKLRGTLLFLIERA